MSAWYDGSGEKARRARRGGAARARVAGRRRPGRSPASAGRRPRAGWSAAACATSLLGRPDSGETDVATDLLPGAGARALRAHRADRRARTARCSCCTRARESSARRCAARASTPTRATRPVWFTSDPLEDLDRRDLTVNAMAFDPAAGELLDPHEGARDLERRVLRAVGDPAARFREDALRPLRVARFAAVLGMDVEERDPRGARRRTDRGERSRPSACAAELEKLVLGAAALAWASRSCARRTCCRSGCPSCRRAAACRRTGSTPTTSTSIRSTPATRRRSGKPVVRWAALLHDIGKPATRVERHGEGTFYHHETVGAEPRRHAARAAPLPGALHGPGRAPGARAHVRLPRRVERRRAATLAAARRPRVRRRAVRPAHRRQRSATASSPANPAYLPGWVERIDRAARGGDVGALGARTSRWTAATSCAALGIGPGPRVGEALGRLLEEVLEDVVAQHARTAPRAGSRSSARGARPAEAPRALDTVSEAATHPAARSFDRTLTLRRRPAQRPVHDRRRPDPRGAAARPAPAGSRPEAACGGSSARRSRS